MFTSPVMCFPFGQVQAINESNKFEAEIRQEQEAKKKQAEEQKQRRAAFKQLQSAFKWLLSLLSGPITLSMLHYCCQFINACVWNHVFQESCNPE